jgi:septum site-determining protein MinD
VTALYFADAAIIVTNPEVSSVRDSDRIIGILASRSSRAERNEPPVETNLLLTRYDPARVAKGEMLTVEDVQEILSVPSARRHSGIGIGVARVEHRHAGRLRRGQPGRHGISRRCRPFLGEQREMRFVQPERRGFFRVLFGRA